MIWRSRSLWLLLIALFLLRDAAGLGVWNAKSTQHWYGGAASVSMDQPTKVNYLPDLTKLEGSTSSDLSMPSSSVFSQQGLGPSPFQAGQSTCGSSSQMAVSEAVTASGSAGSSQSVFPGGQQVSGLLVSQPQLQGSSAVIGTWRQSSKSDVGTPQTSSHLFQQGTLHQGSSGSLPTHQGSYGAVSSGLIKYLPAEKVHASIPQPQSSPQLLHPSQTKPVGVSALTPLQGSSGLSALIPTGLLGHPLASQRSSGSSSDAPQEGPSYGPLPVQGGGSWQTAQSPMPSSGLTLTKYYGPQYFQGVGAWQPSSPDQPALSQIDAVHGKSGVTTTVQQVSSDAVPAQGANIWSSSRHHQAALQTASSQLPDLSKASVVTSARDAPQSSGSSYRAFPSPVASTWKTWQSSRDVPQKSSYYGYPYTQGAGTGQPSSHIQNQPLVQPGQTQVEGSCVCSSQQPAQDTVQKSSSSSLVAPPSWISKAWQMSKLQSGLEMGKLQFVSGTTSQQSSRDAAQTSGSSYGFLPPQVVSTWQTSSFKSPPQTVSKHDAHNPAQHESHSVLNQASPSGQTPSSAHQISTSLRGW